MKFTDQSFFYYERSLWRGHTLESLLRDGDNGAGLLPQSGLADLREALFIVDEWYRQYPIITVKEIIACHGTGTTGSFDPIDFEPSSGTFEFGRVVDIHAVVRQSDPSFKLAPTGKSNDQDLKVHFGLLQLFRANYWPGDGDRVLYKGVLHDIVQVSCLPSDYWQQSGVPLHVTITAEVAHLSGNLPLRSIDLEHSRLEPAWLHDAGDEPETDGGAGGLNNSQGSLGEDLSGGIPARNDTSAQGGNDDAAECGVVQETNNW